MTRKFYPILCALFFSTQLLYASLAPNANRPLIDHLTEVNKEWTHQVPAEGLLLNNWQFNNDVQRIQMHLMLVEHYLRQRPVQHLSPQQLANRLHQLDVLHEYWQAGEFPRNSYHQQRQPYFVDVQGTACAVGYLALQSGEEDLVARIHKENNYAYVRELDYPELMTWADKNGLTTEELAWIQPGYSPTVIDFQTLGNEGGMVDGHINKMIKSDDGETLYIAGDFSEIDGETAGSVIAWDGANWMSLGNGVDGEIFDMKYWNNHLYVVGNFQLVDDPQSTNIAYYDGTGWVGMQQGDMEGTVYTIENEGMARLFIGGDFQKINGEPIPYLAKFENNAWNNSTRIYTSNGYEDIPGAFSVDAPVHALMYFNHRLLVGGDFTATAPGVTNEEVNTLEGVNYLAYWQYDDWVAGLYGTHSRVRTLAYEEGVLVVGGVADSENETISLSYLDAGLWIDVPGFLAFDLENPGIRDLMAIDGQILVLGDFHYSPLGVGYFGFGAAALSLEGYGGAQGFALFDGAVNSGIEFKGDYLFGGAFTEVNGNAVGGIVKMGAIINGNPEPGPALDLNIFLQGDQLMIRYSGMDDNAALHLFNLSGQQLDAINLENTSGEMQLWMGNLPAGTYIYRVVSGDRYQAGKVVKGQ